MDTEDIKEIVRIQLNDVGIIPEDIHFNVAINYYHDNNSLPDINYIIGTILENNNIDNENLQEQNNTTENAPENTNQLEDEDDDESESDNNNLPANNEQNNQVESSNDESDNEENSQREDRASYNEQNEEDDNDSDMDDGSSADEENEFEGIHLNVLPYNILTENQIDDILRMRQEINPNMNENVQIQIITENSNLLDVKKVIKNIDSIPLYMFKNISNSNTNKECLICFDQFVPTDIIRVLPCSHNLHRHCIDEQLKKISYLCPYCKTPAGEYVYYNL